MGVTVLLVEDNDLQRRLAGQALQAAGHRPVFAATAEEAADMIDAAAPQVVVISGALPPDDVRLATYAATAAGRFVVIAVGDGQEDLAAEVGAAGTVARPYLRESLAARLELFASGSAPARVLVVDDTQLERREAVTALARAGHTTFEAGDGVAALTALDAHPEIDLVLLDLVMPHMDGLDFIRTVRAQPARKHLPIIVFTAVTDREAKGQAIDAGADDLLIKPVNAAELHVRVRSIIRLKRRSAELEQALRMRDDLTELLVHDFRSPLANVVMCADMLERRCRNAGLADVAPLLHEIQATSAHLAGLTDDLLDVSRIERGVARPRLYPFAAADVIDPVVARIRRVAEQGEVALFVDAAPGLRLLGDQRWIERVVQNLVDNALKHAPKGSTVRIGASGDATGARFSVSDQGPGVPREQRRHIFEKFAQLGPDDRRGRGLGLAFCRLAVEAHGGVIEAADAEGGQGVEVWFTLPGTKPSAKR